MLSKDLDMDMLQLAIAKNQQRGYWDTLSNGIGREKPEAGHQTETINNFRKNKMVLNGEMPAPCRTKSWEEGPERPQGNDKIYCSSAEMYRSMLLQLFQELSLSLLRLA